MSTLLVHQEYELNSGYKIPSLGLGTWDIGTKDIDRIIRDAVNIGYRHFDCAHAYVNEPAIGQTFGKLFSEGKIQRSEIFITSKIWNTFHSYEQASVAVDISLKDLQLSYLDLCLIHWPTSFEEGGDLVPKDKDGKVSYSDQDYLDTWRALEDAVIAGKIRSIGLSNFNLNQFDRIITTCRIKPANLQVETHPYLPQDDLLKYCREHGITFTSYSPLGSPGYSDRPTEKNLLHEPIVEKIGKKFRKTPAQVLINWALRRNTVVIPKSSSMKRLKENFDVMNFELDEEDMKKIESLNCNLRMVPFAVLSDHKNYPF